MSEMLASLNSVQGRNLTQIALALNTSSLKVQPRVKQPKEALSQTFQDQSELQAQQNNNDHHLEPKQESEKPSKQYRLSSLMLASVRVDELINQLETNSFPSQKQQATVAETEALDPHSEVNHVSEDLAVNTQNTQQNVHDNPQVTNQGKLEQGSSSLKTDVATEMLLSEVAREPVLDDDAFFTDVLESEPAPVVPQVIQPERKNTTEPGVQKPQVKPVLQSQPAFRLAKESLAYEDIHVQIIDDRSQEQDHLIYPVSQSEVRLVGTDSFVKTDTLGRIILRDLPKNSQYLIDIRDPDAQIMPTTIQVQQLASELFEIDNEVSLQRIKVLREEVFSLYQEIAGVTQMASKGSLCGTLASDSVKRLSTQGFSVELDVEAQGPFYFNAHGFLDPSLRYTTERGRFCFFNMETGPVSLTIYDQEGQFIFSYPLAIFPGSHQEKDFYVQTAQDIKVALGLMNSATEQLSAQDALSGFLNKIDFAELLLVGRGDVFAQEDEGLVAMDSVYTNNQYGFAISNSSDLEPALYQFPVGQLSENYPVVPLMPRGFIEDMALFARRDYDPALGSVFVEHAWLKGQGPEDGHVVFRLVDSRNHKVAEAWHYQDGPLNRALFFNIEPGVYQLVVETAEGGWLAAQVIYVYNELTTFVHTGSHYQRVDILSELSPSN